MQKYELTDIILLDTERRKSYRRIRALKTFENPLFGVINTGDYGGFVENERNLSQSGSCWVAGDGVICENARVVGNGGIFNAIVKGHALVRDNAYVGLGSVVMDNACIAGNTKVVNNSVVCGITDLDGNVLIDGSEIAGFSRVYGDLTVENSKISGSAVISNSKVSHRCFVIDNAQIIDSHVSMYSFIGGESIIKNAYLIDNVEVDGVSVIDPYLLGIKLKITGLISLVDVQLSFHMSKDVLRIVPDVKEYMKRGFVVYFQNLEGDDKLVVATEDRYGKLIRKVEYRDIGSVKDSLSSSYNLRKVFEIIPAVQAVQWN